MTAAVRPLAVLAVLGAAATVAVAQESGPLGTPVPRPPIGTLLDENAGPSGFVENQLRFARVAGARNATQESLRSLFQERGLTYPAREIFIRVFKHERVLELWGRSDPDAEFSLIKEYPVCALPGQLGPKRRMGDVQVPEGIYFIDEFNPNSAYHLSLRVNYPNLSDRLRREHLALGGDIYIHGGCETIGCVPIEDQNIKELYWIAVQATDAGQAIIPIHIFPARLDDDRLRWLNGTFQPERDLRLFWANLAEAYRYFEQTRRVPWVTVAEDGRYAVPPLPTLAAGSAARDTALAATADSTPDPADSTSPAPIAPDSVPADSALPRGVVRDSVAADTVPPDSAGAPPIPRGTVRPGEGRVRPRGGSGAAAPARRAG